MTGIGAGWPAPDGPDFAGQTLPYGVYSPAPGSGARVGVAVGEQVLDLSGVASGGLLDGADAAWFRQPSLNAFMAAGPDAWRAVRARLQQLLADTRHQRRVAPHLVARSDVRLHLPFTVADYVDFYSSQHHAENVGRLFRPDAAPLPPNWKHLPIGYHGRAGTVVVSGTPIVRPCGQRKAPDEPAPTFGQSRRLDVEAEVGFVVGVPSPLGSRVPPAALRHHVFGVVVVNDWSARDIQAWESVPLGPFLGKSFATSISPWVVPLDALAHARVPGPLQQPEPAAYLRDDEPRGLDIALEIEWNGHVVSRPPFAAMYWSPGQQLAHMTVNGASLRVGDLYASGTVSGPGSDERGSFLELSRNGRDPLRWPDGSTRTFLEDGDHVVIRATAPGAEGGRVGLGAVSGRIVPAAGTGR